MLTTLATDASRCPEEVHTLTRRGEARIEPCQTCDLVGEYRLVYVQEGHPYCFLFAGTHDDCSRWLEHNKNRKPAMPSAAPAEAVAQTEAVTPLGEPAGPAEDLDYDDIVMQHIDESMLRRVFRGLCGDEPIMPSDRVAPGVRGTDVGSLSTDVLCAVEGTAYLTARSGRRPVACLTRRLQRSRSWPRPTI